MPLGDQSEVNARAAGDRAYLALRRQLVHMLPERGLDAPIECRAPAGFEAAFDECDLVALAGRVESDTLTSADRATLAALEPENLRTLG
jgi:hypothetical protein